MWGEEEEAASIPLQLMMQGIFDAILMRRGPGSWAVCSGSRTTDTSLTLCTADLVRRLAFKMKVRQRHRGVLLRFDAEGRCLHQLGGFAQRDLRFSEQFLDSFWLILTYSPQLPRCLAWTSCGKLPWWSMMMILHVSSIFGSNPNKKKPHTNSNSPTANGLRCGLQGRRNCAKRGWESTSHLQHCA